MGCLRPLRLATARSRGGHELGRIDLRPRHLPHRKLFVDKHGEEASIEAAMRADKRLDAGDLDGQAVWLRVVGAVKELLQQKPERGQAIH